MREGELLGAIREGMEIDPSPASALEWQMILSEAGFTVPIYRIKRNLYMLVHTGVLHTIHKRGQTYFAGS